MTPLFTYLFLALFLSFLCSLLESVILSVTHSHINLLIKNQKRGARLLKELKKNINKPLAAILTLNTVANTIGAAGVGAEVLKLYGSEWVALASVVLTLCILIFSEMIPKNIGVTYWKKLALHCAFIIKWFIIITYPFVILFQGIVNLTQQEKKPEKTMSREEMMVAADTGLEEGVLADKESRIIKNLLRLHLILAEDVMTPRSVVYALQKDLTVDNVLKNHSPIYFSRIPVYDKNIDDIIGMVLRFKIIDMSAKDQPDCKIKELMMPIHSIPEKTPVATILDELIQKREHLFIVTDDVGGTSGLITLEDVIETLLGVEIVDEFDSVDDMRKFALEQWEERKKSRTYQYQERPHNPGK